MINLGFPSSSLLAPVSHPSSYEALPPISIPIQSEVTGVARLRQSLIQESGISPGSYSEIGQDLHPRLATVYDHLLACLLEELSEVDAFDLCVRLYDRNEEYLGYIFRAHFDTAARRRLLGSSESSIQNQWLWERLSPYTESIRWLIEIVLKHCDMQGYRVGVLKLNRLIELARAIYEWDLMWEQIHRNVIPHQVTITSDFNLDVGLTRWANNIKERYDWALMPTMQDNERVEFELYQAQEYKLTPKEASNKLMNALNTMELDQALLETREYTLSDWGNFCLGLLYSFEGDEYRKVVKLTTLESYLSLNWNLDRQRIAPLLQDYGLSKEAVQATDLKRLRPVEFGRRDSRLLRRPVVILNRGDSVRCLYGVETIYRGHLLILERLQSGRIDLVHQSDNKKLKKAVGHLQKKLGRVFERNIADECHARGYDYTLEKGRVAGNPIPQGCGFGPVDVFIVDRIHKRFVLVEAKNVADEGSIPRKMQSERDEFSKFIHKVNSQVGWFMQRIAYLKVENNIPDAETYSVEGVIVVNSPRLWMFAYDRPVPILDVFNFLECLEQGKEFMIAPVEFNTRAGQ